MFGNQAHSPLSIPNQSMLLSGLFEDYRQQSQQFLQQQQQQQQRMLSSSLAIPNQDSTAFLSSTNQLLPCLQQYSQLSVQAQYPQWNQLSTSSVPNLIYQNMGLPLTAAAAATTTMTSGGITNPTYHPVVMNNNYPPLNYITQIPQFYQVTQSSTSHNQNSGHSSQQGFSQLLSQQQQQQQQQFLLLQQQQQSQQQQQQQAQHAYQQQQQQILSLVQQQQQQQQQSTHLNRILSQPFQQPLNQFPQFQTSQIQIQQAIEKQYHQQQQQQQQQQLQQQLQQQQQQQNLLFQQQKWAEFQLAAELQKQMQIQAKQKQELQLFEEQQRKEVNSNCFQGIQSEEEHQQIVETVTDPIVQFSSQVMASKSSEESTVLNSNHLSPQQPQQPSDLKQKSITQEISSCLKTASQNHHTLKQSQQSQVYSVESIKEDNRENCQMSKEEEKQSRDEQWSSELTDKKSCLSTKGIAVKKISKQKRSCFSKGDAMLAKSRCQVEEKKNVRQQQDLENRNIVGEIAITATPPSSSQNSEGLSEERTQLVELTKAQSKTEKLPPISVEKRVIERIRRGEMVSTRKLSSSVQSNQSWVMCEKCYKKISKNIEQNDVSAHCSRCFEQSGKETRVGEKETQMKSRKEEKKFWDEKWLSHEVPLGPEYQAKIPSFILNNHTQMNVCNGSQKNVNGHLTAILATRVHKGSTDSSKYDEVHELIQKEIESFSHKNMHELLEIFHFDLEGIRKQIGEKDSTFFDMLKRQFSFKSNMRMTRFQSLKGCRY